MNKVKKTLNLKLAKMHYSLNFPAVIVREIIQLKGLKSTLAVNENIYMRVGVHMRTVSTTDTRLWLTSLTSVMACLHSVMKPGVVTFVLPYQSPKVQNLCCHGVVPQLKTHNIWHF